MIAGIRKITLCELHIQHQSAQKDIEIRRADDVFDSLDAHGRILVNEQESTNLINQLLTKRGLGPAQGQVIPILVLLDDVFHRIVGYISISWFYQQQGGQDAGKTPIAILERVNFKKHHHEHRDDQQWVQLLLADLIVGPLHQLGNELPYWTLIAWPMCCRICGTRRLL